MEQSKEWKPKAKNAPFPTMGQAEIMRKQRKIGRADDIGSSHYIPEEKEAKWAEIKFKKLPADLVVSSYGVVENEKGHQPYIVIYQSTDKDMCLRFFRFFFTDGTRPESRKPTHKVPYYKEQEGTYYLIIDSSELPKYLKKLRSILSLAIKYSKNSSAMYTMFEYYAGTVLTWHRHVEVKQLLDHSITVDKLRQSMIYYSQPELIKLVRT